MRLLAIVLFATAPLFAFQSTPSAAPDILTKAHASLENGKPADAIAMLQQLAAEQSSLKGVQHELGLAYYRTGKLLEAQHAFTQAMQQDPADIESVQMEGLVLYRLGQPAAAIPYLERVRQWTPNANTDANYVLGLCYLNAQRYDEARKSFAAQFSVPADSASAYLLLGTMLMHADLPELAAVQAGKALQLSPALPLAHFMVGEVALFKSDVDKAITEFELERAINPGYPPLFDRLGDAYFRAGKLEQAQQALTKAISLDTSSTGPFILMGKVLLRRQDIPTAILYLKHAEKMDANNYVTHSLLSQAYRRAGQENEAKMETDLASKIHVENQLKLDLVK